MAAKVMSVENQELFLCTVIAGQSLVQTALQINYICNFEFYFSLSLKAIQIMCMWTCRQQGYYCVCLLLLNFDVAFDSFNHQI